MRQRPSLLLRAQASLALVIAVATATAVRSVEHEKWVTVLASAMLVTGAAFALAKRTWGVGLVLATGVAFPTAHLLGMAPGWFWLVGLVSAMPFALTRRPMARFDAAATKLFATIAIGAGIAGAIAWYALGPSLASLLYP